MAKTKEELQQLKKEYETLNNKLSQLSENELQEVIGGELVSQEIVGFHNINSGINGNLQSGSMIHAPTFDDTNGNGGINPNSTKGWFGSNNQN